MLNLNELQQQFKAYLFSPQEGVINWVSNPPQGSPQSRMQIYSNAYRIRLIEVLRNHYPVVAKILGDEIFLKVARDYLELTPSHYANIRYFGDQLASFLTSYTKCDFPCSKNAIIELAQFEWALTRAVDAADSTLASTEMLSKLKPEQWPFIQLTLHPSVQLLECQWNITGVWYAVKEEEAIPEWRAYDELVNVIIWRQDNTAYYQVLTPVQHKIIQGFNAGLNFEVVCETLLNDLPEDEIPQALGNTLHFLLSRNAVSELS